MDKTAENFFKMAQYDLKTAKSCYKSKLFIVTVEKCHNALEKILKAVIAYNNETPPMIHDLLRLTSESVIGNLQEEIKVFLDDLNDVYMNTRYPDDFDQLEEKLTQDEVSKILKQTKRIFTWLKKKID